MSQFLGPIHHWIFAQVCLCESRGEVLSLGLQEKYGDGAVKCWDDLKEQFPGQFEGADLEELLAGQGIHPALDAMIATVQSREAGLIAWGLEQAEGAEVLRDLFSSDGSTWGEKLRAAGKGSPEPRALFGALREVWLEGMPCDVSGEILDESEDRFDWAWPTLVLSKYWERSGLGSSEIFPLHLEWMNSFIRTASKGESCLVCTESPLEGGERYVFSIRRKEST